MQYQTLFTLIMYNENQQARRHLQPFLNTFTQIRSTQNSTLMHSCSFNNNIEFAKYLIDQCQQQSLSKEELVSWLQMEDDDGFTCLQNAVFQGNIKMMELFLGKGCNIQKLNKQGLNLLHIAVQNNTNGNLQTLYYLICKGIDINGKDFGGRTPLDWACNKNSQYAAFLLISLGANFNRSDNEMYTPLHRAVLSDSTSIVKRLVHRGCLDTKNNDGKTARDLAKDYQCKEISEFFSSTKKLAWKYQSNSSYSKYSIVRLPFYLFLGLLVLILCLNLGCFIMGLKNSRMGSLQIIFYVFFFILGLIGVILFIVAGKSDPGKLGQSAIKKSQQQIKELIEKNDMKRICFDCKVLLFQNEIPKPPRSHHCQACKSCICVFDHHCPWIGNCIGAKNYGIFLFFLIWTVLLDLYTIAFQIQNLAKNDWKGETYSEKVIFGTVSGITLILASVMSIPLIILLVTQVKNCMNNITTYEYYKKINPHYARNKKSSHKQNLNEMSQIQNQQILLETHCSPSPCNSMEVNKTYSTNDPKQLTWRYNCKMMCYGNWKIREYHINGI